MADSPKLRRLRQLRELVAKGKLSDAEKKGSVVTDSDGITQIRLSDPDILAVLDRRIAAEQGR